jgi:hypothetical protein
MKDVLDTLRKPNNTYANGKKVGTFIYSFYSSAYDETRPSLPNVRFSLRKKDLECVCIAINRDRTLAFCMGLHQRLGAQSTVMVLSNEVLELMSTVLLDRKKLELSQILQVL